MATKLVEHLVRCDTESLVSLLGDATIALLAKVGNGAMVPAGLAELVVSAYGEDGTLRNPTIRQLLFDKLNDEEGRALCELLALSTAAPLMTLSGADFDNDPHNTEMLFRWFGVPYEADDGRELEGSRKVTASHKLRTHQVAAYLRLRRTIADPTASALVHMPFGAGKLRLIATAVLDLYRSEPDGRVIVWLAPGEALCEEAFTELGAVWQQLGSRDVTVYRLYGDRPMPDLDNLGNCIIVADIGKLAAKDPGLAALGRKVRVVILGDAEHVGHPLGAAIIEKMSEEGAFSVVGISAFPGNAVDASPCRQAMGARFSGACIQIESEDPVSMLQIAGDVSEVRIELKSPPPSTIVIDDTGLELAPESTSELSRNVERNEALLELLLAEAKASGKIVFFATTAQHARLFAGLLRLRGVRAMAVTNEMSLEQRSLVVQKFNAREEKVLCVHGIFVSGGTVPGVSVGIVAAPTISEAVLSQMVGRLASDRGPAVNPLRLVVIADPIPRFVRLIESLGAWNELKI